MDKHEAAIAILEKALEHAAFEGWSAQTLAQAATDVGFSAGDAVRVFPGGVGDALDALARHADRRMLDAYAALPSPPQRIRDKIAALVRLRLELYTPHRESLRRASVLLALPGNLPLGLKITARTVDAMWHAAGDTSADFNWYSKRFLLAGVYGATLAYWLNDKSESQRESWAFLDRRIADVMAIEKAKAWLKRTR